MRVVSAGNTTLAATFTQRAAWIQTEYLKLLWNDDIDFFAVYKENLQNNSKFHCTGPDDADDTALSAEVGLAALVVW